MLELKGLYAITDSDLMPEQHFVNHVEYAIVGGARVIQYRDKSTDVAKRQQQATALQTLCACNQIPLIINDDIALAQQVGAAGVHIGKDDMDLAAARQQLGADALIGISCYNQFSLAQQAVAQGADYIAFGSFFPSAIKPQAVRAELHLLQRAKAEFSCPVVAIGGITVENASTLITAGADCVAVISGIFAQADIEAAAHAYAELFNT